MTNQTHIDLMTPAMALALTANFNSVEEWQRSFAALGETHRGSAGAVVLAFQPQAGSLLNEWVASGAQPSAAGVPLLLMTLPIRADFMTHIDWADVYTRYQAAVHDASEPFAATQGDVARALYSPLVLDVRRAGMYEQATTMLPGATWRDPASVGTWARELPAGREVLVYCVYGHEVGRSTALRLRAAGVNARFLSGGIDEWASAGKPLAAKGNAP